MVLKTPAAVPPYDPSRADMRLPNAAYKFRADNKLLTPDDLLHLNITAWLYRDKQGAEGILVNPNTTIAQLRAQFGPADTRDAEVGIHSEAKAGEYFRTHPDLTVLQIFTERIPCPMMCAPMLGNYFAGIPVFYYYDRRSWSGKPAGEVLEGIYGVDARAIAAAQIADQYDRLANEESRMKGDHAGQLRAIRNTWNPMGRVVQVFNPAKIPELSIWDDVESTLNATRDSLRARRFAQAGIFLSAARLEFLLARSEYLTWAGNIAGAANQTQWAIGGVSAALILAAVGAFLAAPLLAPGAGATAAADGAVANETAAQNLVRLRVLAGQFDNVNTILDSAEEIEEAAQELKHMARVTPR
jgi:hypothetical protein